MPFTDLVDQTGSFKVSFKSWCACLIDASASVVSTVQGDYVNMCRVHLKICILKLSWFKRQPHAAARSPHAATHSPHVATHSSPVGWRREWEG